MVFGYTESLTKTLKTSGYCNFWETCKAFTFIVWEAALGNSGYDNSHYICCFEPIT